MDLLDQLDEAHRRQGISDYVNSLPENRISEIDAQLLLNELNTIESNGSNGIFAPVLEVNSESKQQPLLETNSISPTALKNSRPEFQALSLLSREDGETVRRLMNELHLQQVDNQSLKLRINHLQLQNEALFNSEQQHKHELDQTLFVVATLEQDKLLLETKLRDVAGFEQRRDDHMMDDIRGKLLHLSNARCEEFVNSMDTSQRENDEKAHQYEQHVQELEAENQALIDKLEELSTEIAQRAIMYAAQERRMLDSLTTQNNEAQEKSKVLVEVQAKLEQLQTMYDKLSHEHTELTIQHNSDSTSKEALVLQLEELQEQLQIANSDIAEMGAQNQSLETMVSHLRGSDVDDMGLNILQEIEKVRHQARIREESLRVQLSEACEQLAIASSSRDAYAQESERLHQENEDFRRLLHNLDAMGTSHSDHNLSIQSSNYEQQDTSRVNLTMESLLLGQEDEEDESAAVVVDDGTIATAEGDNGSLTWLISPSHAAAQQEQGDRTNESPSKSTDVLSKLIKQLKDINTEDIVHLRAEIIRVLHDHFSISESEEGQLIDGFMQLLTNRVSFAEDTASISSDYEVRMHDMKKEMKHLKQVLKKVLVRAAELGVAADTAIEPVNTIATPSVDENRIKTLTDAVEVLMKEKEQLEEHLNHYRHEIQQLEDMIQSSKEIGRHEASLELETRIVQAEASGQHFKGLSQTLQTKLEQQEKAQQELQGQLEMAQRQLDSDKLAIAAHILDRDIADKRAQELQEDLTNAQQDQADLLQRYEALILRVTSKSNGNSREIDAIDASVNEEATQTEAEMMKEGNVITTESQTDTVLPDSIIDETDKANQHQIADQIQIIEALQGTLNSKLEEIEQLQYTLQRNTSEISILRDDLIVAENERQVMRLELQSIKENNQRLQSEFDRLNLDLQSTRDEALELRHHLHSNDSELQQLRMSLHASESKLLNYSAEQEDARDSQFVQNMEAKEKEIAKLQVEILMQNSEIQRLQGEVFVKVSDLQTLQLEYNAAKDQIAKLMYEKEQSEQLQSLLLYEKQGLLDEISFLQMQPKVQADLERKRYENSASVDAVHRELHVLEQKVEDGVISEETTRDVVVIDKCEQLHQQDTYLQQVHDLETQILSLQNELRFQQMQQQRQLEQFAGAKTSERAHSPKKEAKEQAYIEELELHCKQSNEDLDSLRLENGRLLEAQTSLQDKLQSVKLALQEAETAHKQELQTLAKQSMLEKAELSASLEGLQQSLHHATVKLETIHQEYALQEKQYRHQLSSLVSMSHSLLLSIAPAALASESISSTNPDESSVIILLQSIEESLRSATFHYAQWQEHQKQTLLDAKQIMKALEEDLANERLASGRKDAKHKSALQKLKDAHEEELRRVESALRTELLNTSQQQELDQQQVIHEMQMSFEQEREDLQAYFASEMLRIRESVATLQASYETQLQQITSMELARQEQAVHVAQAKRDPDHKQLDAKGEEKPNSSSSSSPTRSITVSLLEISHADHKLGRYSPEASSSLQESSGVATKKFSTSVPTPECSVSYGTTSDAIVSSPSVRHNVTEDFDSVNFEETDAVSRADSQLVSERGGRFDGTKHHSTTGTTTDKQGTKTKKVGNKSKSTRNTSVEYSRSPTQPPSRQDTESKDNAATSPAERQEQEKEKYLALVQELHSIQHEHARETRFLQAHLITLKEQYASLQQKHRDLETIGQEYLAKELKRQQSLRSVGVNTAPSDKKGSRPVLSLSRMLLINIPPEHYHHQQQQQHQQQKEIATMQEDKRTTERTKQSVVEVGTMTEDSVQAAASVDAPVALNAIASLSIEDMQERLSAQKQHLLNKYAKRLLEQQQQHDRDKQQLQELFATEKNMILRMVRQECQDIIIETQRLLLAKRELSLHQAQVNEIIAELSQRSLFQTHPTSNHQHLPLSHHRVVPFPAPSASAVSSSVLVSTQPEQKQPQSQSQSQQQQQQQQQQQSSAHSQEPLHPTTPPQSPPIPSASSSFFFSTPSLLSMSPIIAAAHANANAHAHANTTKAAATTSLPFPSFAPPYSTQTNAHSNGSGSIPPGIKSGGGGTTAATITTTTTGSVPSSLSTLNVPPPPPVHSPPHPPSFPSTSSAAAAAIATTTAAALTSNNAPARDVPSVSQSTSSSSFLSSIIPSFPTGTSDSHNHHHNHHHHQDNHTASASSSGNSNSSSSHLLHAPSSSLLVPLLPTLRAPNARSVAEAGATMATSGALVRTQPGTPTTRSRSHPTLSASISHSPSHLLYDHHPFHPPPPHPHPPHHGGSSSSSSVGNTRGNSVRVTPSVGSSNASWLFVNKSTSALPSFASSATTSIAAATAGHNHKLYPEMLSPALTRALVQEVYDRAVTEDDPYRALQLHSTATATATATATVMRPPLLPQQQQQQPQHHHSSRT